MYSIYFYNHYGGVAVVGSARTDFTRLGGSRTATPQLLYSPHVEDRRLVDCVLKTEVNKAGRLTFTPAPGNPCVLTKLTTECALLRDAAEVWRGRVLYDEGELSRTRSVLCEGILGYLRDGVVPPFTFSGSAAELLGDLLATYNDGQIDEWKKFDLGDVADFATEAIEYECKDYKKIADEVDAIVKKAGGYLRAYRSAETGRNVLDWTKRSGRHCGQKIRFGDNLLTLKDKISAEDVFTVLIPLGKRETSDVETTYGGDGITVEVNSTADMIFNFCKSVLGLTTAAACGVLANAAAESNYDSEFDDGIHFGLFGWSGDRRTRLEAIPGYDTVGGQLGFLKSELESLFQDVLRYVRGVTNSGRGAYDAAYYWCYDFQLPEDRVNESRARGNAAINDVWPTYATADAGGEVIVPAMGERVTIAEVNGGQNYLVNEAAAEAFGWIWKTQTYDDVEDAAELMQKGEETLRDGGMLRKLDMSAVDLSQLGVEVESIETGVYCDLIVPPLGLIRIDADAPGCTKSEIDVLHIEKSKYTFGAGFEDLTQQNAAHHLNVQDVRNGADGVVYLAAAAQSYARSAVTSAGLAAGNAIDAMSAAASAQSVLSSLPDSIAAATAALQFRYSFDANERLTGEVTVRDVVSAIQGGKNVIGTNAYTGESCSFTVQYSFDGSNYRISLSNGADQWQGSAFASTDALVLTKV